MFEIDLSLSDPIRVNPWVAPYVRAGYAWGSWKRGKMGATNSGAGCGNGSIVLGGLERVLLIPWWWHFLWPLTVTRPGFKYLRINVSPIFGHPFKKPCCMTFKSVEIWGLHNNQCANVTAFARMLTKCVNIASAGWREGWGAKRIQGPGCSKVGSVARLPVFTQQRLAHQHVPLGGWAPCVHCGDLQNLICGWSPPFLVG